MIDEILQDNELIETNDDIIVNADEFINSSANKKHYVTKELLMQEYQKSLATGSCTDKLLNCFQKIAKRFSTIYRNQNRTDWNAIVNYAVSEAWQKWKSYDPSRTDNIFSFYTTMIANDMRNHYKLINKGKSINISIESLFQRQSDN